jgi:NAD(P)H-hydrate repair Nnr-like enzyme with NAD(P)H-hydrate dehydratase domain
MLQALEQEQPLAFLVGDTGLGQGSRRLYRYLADCLAEFNPSSMVLHYLQPDVDGHGRVLLAVQELSTRPKLIADAGFMYAAKMSGQSPEYDLFTPDAGELAFLADEKAPHPFYTRGFILSEENKVPSLITRAYAQANAARHLLVKGSMDYVADSSGVLSTVSQPCCEAMEAVGGTGDTLTGVVSCLIESGLDVPRAAELAARINRTAGSISNPRPASQIMDIICCLPEAYELVKIA